MKAKGKIKTTAHLTCPHCSAVQSAVMPTEACQYFYKCQRCGKMIKPKEGDCCVFCSYADTKCPSKQKENILATTTSSTIEENSVK